jgi:transmembrane sensor
MSDKLENEKIWNLMAKKMAGEITHDEEEELRVLLQEHSYVSYVDEMLANDWKDSYNYYQPAKVASLFEQHQQRLGNVIEEENNIEELVEEPVKQGKLRSMWRYAAAACIAVVLFATWQWWPSVAVNKTDVVYEQQLVTQKGSRSQIVLPDGSKVWLNAGSTLDYPKQFNGKTRTVQLQGEAYFEVAKNADQPFIVHTKTFDIKVLGTGFNVRAYPDEDSAVTSLIHGSVEVITGGKEKRTILLKPNEKVTLVTAIAAVEATENTTVPQTDLLATVPETMVLIYDTVQQETAWVNNKLAFKKTPLVKVAQVLENWFGTEIRFRNEEKKTLNFTGVFEKENLDEILQILEATKRFHYKKDSSGIIWIE